MASLLNSIFPHWPNIGNIACMKKEESVLIIGGGASGLMAATLLAGKMKVTVLEAKPQTGGRIHSLLQKGTAIEAGAEFIHGKLPLTLSLLASAGIKYAPAKGKMYHFRDGSFVIENEMAEGWDKLLDDMKTSEQDMALETFFETFYATPDNAALRKEVTGYAEGFDLADITKASVKSLYAEWNAEDGENFRIPEGYSSLIQFLENKAIALGVKIITNKVIRQVDWHANDVTALTLTGEQFKANKLLVTVPVSVLATTMAAASINFTPEIDSYQKAAGQIGYGSVIKIVLEFNDRFWPKDAGFIISDELFRTWWTQLPGTSAVLTGWLGGPNATTLSNVSDDTILNKALQSLAAIFSLPIIKLQEMLVGSFVFNWQQDPFSLGGYSYDTVESAAAKKLLNRPLDNTLFFAGEALYTGAHNATVEAALQSGEAAAQKILSNLVS
jgi:monoamine oxidase